jgi:GNAT superfamily N-acetyltransferase
VTELPADLTRRGLGPEDADAAADLVLACDRTYLDWAPQGWRPPPKDEERERWQSDLGQSERWTLGVFDPSGQLSGLASIMPATDETGDVIEATGHLGALFVHPDRWRQGIASRLLREAEEAMRERGWSRVMLRTPVGAPAERFYEANGWTASDHTEYLEVIDMWVSRYEKDLNVSGGGTPTC